MKIKDAVYVYRLFSGDRLQWHGRYHAHGVSEFEVHIFLEGTGSFLQNAAKYPIKPGMIFLSAAGDFHSILPAALIKPVTYYAFLFSVEDNDELSQDVHRVLSTVLKKTCIFSSIDTSTRFWLEEILALANSPEKYLNRSAEYLLASFILSRFYAYTKSNSEKHPANKKKSVVIIRAIRYMEEHIHENLKIKALAGILNVSPEYFIRLFRREVHTTPHRYFLHLKIGAATGYLTTTDKAVKEIAGTLGFDNQFCFSSAFKRCLGISPSGYRNIYFQKNSSISCRLD